MSVSGKVLALAEARGELNAARERVYALVEGRTEAELLAPPKDGGWSAAEVLDHLRTAEEKLVKGLTKVERGEAVRLPRRVWFYRLPMAVAFPRLKLKAPRPVRPRPPAELEPAEVLRRMRASREGLLAFADRLGPERFARFVFPHFLLGRFDGLDWFRFLTRHEGRHADQLQRTLAKR